MFAFLRKLAGIEADVAIRERNEKLAALEEQGEQLKNLAECLKDAQAAAASRTASGTTERENLQRSRSGAFRLKLDSSSAVKT